MCKLTPKICRTPLEIIVFTKRANKHCQGIMALLTEIILHGGFKTAEGQKAF
jgi:hypothetical protein